jgi:hypothetical protein
MDREEYADDEAAFVSHLDSLGVPHQIASSDARRLGLDRNTEEGALVAFSAALRPANPVHRGVAWILLIAFGLPCLLALLHLARELFGWMLPS